MREKSNYPKKIFGCGPMCYIVSTKICTSVNIVGFPRREGQYGCKNIRDGERDSPILGEATRLLQGENHNKRIIFHNNFAEPTCRPPNRLIGWQPRAHQNLVHKVWGGGGGGNDVS